MRTIKQNIAWALVTLLPGAYVSLTFARLDAQAAPAAVAPGSNVGFQLPTVGGTLSYAATVSEALIFGYNGNGGTGSSTVFSGDVGYLSVSPTHPFSVVYSGGYLASTGGQPNSVYQNLAVSQVLRAGRWNFIAADVVSYLPQTAIGGLSGVPGVGDLSTLPGQDGTGFTQGILSRNDARVDNATSGSVIRNLTESTSANATGVYAIERFFGSSNTQPLGFGNPGYGLDSNSITGSAGLSHRIDARNTIGASYTYSHFKYLLAVPFSFTTQTGSLEYTRVLTRQLTLFASAGPQRTSSSNPLLSAPSLNVGANADLTYAGERTLYAVNYTRGVNNGSGIIAGSRVDALSLNANHSLDRNWSVSGSASYAHSVSLPNLLLPSFSAQTFAIGVQTTRTLRRNLFGFASYTIQRQTTKGFAQTSDLYSGTSQILGVGITYSPRPIQLGRR